MEIHYVARIVPMKLKFHDDFYTCKNGGASLHIKTCNAHEIIHISMRFRNKNRVATNVSEVQYLFGRRIWSLAPSSNETRNGRLRNTL